MSRTFTELTNKNLGKLFNTFQTSPELTGFIVNGIPVAIASTLRKAMIDNPAQTKELVIGDVCKFTLAINKRGDSLAITPGFEVLDAGLALLEQDDFETSNQQMEALAISLIENPEFLKAATEGMSGKIFNDEEWVELEKGVKGIKFSDEADSSVAVAGYILTFMEVLSNNKDASQDVEYEVPGLGTFKVKEDKGKWNLTLSFDKAFKTNCKSDKLVDSVSTLDLN